MTVFEVVLIGTLSGGFTGIIVALGNIVGELKRINE